jgi:hypothetical protein
MKKIILVFSILFLCCALGKKVIIDKHVFYAGSVKEGQEIAKMHEWKIVRVDTCQDGNGAFYLFHYKELELK